MDRSSPRALLALALLAAAALANASAAPCFPAPLVAAASRLHTTDAAYASFTIDPSRNRGLFNVDFRDPRLVYLASELGGGVIRFGGGGADTTIFATEAGGAACAAPLLRPGFECLNTTTLDALLDLSAAARAPLVVGLALCPAPRGPSSWNATVAAAEIAHIRARAALPILGYELGNECNAHGVAPADQAAAFGELARVLDAAAFPAGARPRLYGPDADGAGSYGEPKALCAYLAAFVAAANALGGGGLAAVTHHEYIQLTAATVLNASMLDWSRANAAAVVAAVRSANATVPIWAGETALHTGNSAGDSLVANCSSNGLCGRFGSVIWYADAMGAKAAAGYALFARQDLVGASYALINTSLPNGALVGGFTPSPDYYLLHVWQRVVGEGVLALALAPPTPPSVRGYAFCARGAAAPAVALVLINLANETACVGAPAFARAGAALTRYSFTAGDAAAGVGAWTARLNGVELRLRANGALPALEGAVEPLAGGIALPGESVSLLVVPAAAGAAGACAG